jgi:hypothetical protein
MHENRSFLVLGVISLVMILSMCSAFFRLNLPVQPHYDLEIPIIIDQTAPDVKVNSPSTSGSQAKKFHFIFNSDCSRGTGFHYVSFMTFYSFLTMYPEDSGHTLTELYSCDNPRYIVPPWHRPGILPSHCKLATVKPFHSYNATMASHGYLPYNKPVGLAQLLSGDWKDKDDDDVIVIIDPDFYFLKPLSPLFLNIDKNEIINGYYGVGAWNNRKDEEHPNLASVVDLICPGCKVCESNKI